MLVLSAVVPHSPLLAERVGGEKCLELQATVRAFAELEERMYASSVETIVMISPHAQHYSDAFSANMSPSYIGTLKTFGDHETAVAIQCDIPLLDRIQNVLRHTEDVPFTLTSNKELDYGYTVPLLLLTKHLKNVRLVPLAPSLLDAQSHVEFGKNLQGILDEQPTRIAFIASADLSHKLTEHSPGGKSVEGPAFDDMIRSKLKTLDEESLLSMDSEAIEAAGQCGYRPIMTLVGLLHGKRMRVEELCYESPFGIGYLTEVFEPV